MNIKIKKQQLLLLALLFFSAVVYFWRLNQPAQEYFDEAYHVPAARLMADNDVRAYEWWHQPLLNYTDGVNHHDWLHPPLAKLIQAASINILGDIWGDQSLTWRMPSALAGLSLIVAVYYLARQFFFQFNNVQNGLQEGLQDNSQDNSRFFFLTKFSQVDVRAFLASLLTAASGLVLVQSRIAMNDIFLTLWLCLAVLFFFRWQPQAVSFKLQKIKQGKNINLLLSGIFLGLAAATKWSAVFLIIFFLFKISYLILKQNYFKLWPLVVFSLVLMPALIYLLSFGQMFLLGKNWDHFKQLHQQIFWYQTRRLEGHAYGSTPDQWLLNLRPIWYWTETEAASKQTANIYLVENPALHLLGLSALIYFLIRIWRAGRQFYCYQRARQKGFSKKIKLYLNLILLYSVVWVPWIFSPRIMFYFHYLPAVPLLNIISAEFLQSAVKPFSQFIYWSTILLIMVTFFIFYPQWTGITVSQDWAQQLYFIFPAWR